LTIFVYVFKEKAFILNNMTFSQNISLDKLNELGKDNMTGLLGINFTKIGSDFLEATMPVDSRTKQPFGILHGGANVVLAETLGSVASGLTLDPEKQFSVGIEVNANHLKSVKEGLVKGIVRPIHLGKSTQVWEIKIYNSQEELSCISRITLAVMEKR
jgi:1,4-dihydroxy-2-naphthoyl-CoA hydrolase